MLIDRSYFLGDSYELIGLDTPTPFLKLDNLIFKGTWENIVGTDLMFSIKGTSTFHSICHPILSMICIIRFIFSLQNLNTR